MVKKLIKYDFMSFFRLLFPVQMIVIGIAALNRLIQLFEVRNNVTYNATFISSIVLLAVACIAALIMTFIISIVRFYQGLYSQEGYLSHTLPVTPAQHIVSKLLTSMIFEVGTLFSILVAMHVATLGDVNIELYKAGFYLFGEMFKYAHGHLFLYILEVILIFFAAEACSFLMLYFCISIGQLANRKKVLLAFGVFFGLYTLLQIISTVLIIIGSTLMMNEYWQKIWEQLGKWVDAHVILSLHLLALILIVFYLIIGTVFFLISKKIMTKKLNLQ